MKERLIKRIGRRIKHFRIEANMSQREFAKAIGYSQSMVALIELGKSDCSIAFIEKAISKLKIKAENLFVEQMEITI